MSKKMFNVARLKRIKTAANESNLAGHNFRIHKKIKNVNYEKIYENVYLVGDENINFNKKFLELKNKFNFKYTKDKNVKFDEIVISATPEFFQGKSKEEINQYFIDNIKILKKHFFKVDESVVSAVIHYDEKTPHLHFVACPLIKKDKKIITRGKDKGKEIEGEFVELSHDQLFGNKQKLREFQTIMNQELVKLGYNLSRGQKNTGIKHTELTKYNEKIEAFKKTKTDDFDIRISTIEKLNAEYSEMNSIKKTLNAPRFMQIALNMLKGVKNFYAAYKAVKRDLKQLEKQNEELRERLNKQATTKQEIAKNAANTEKMQSRQKILEAQSEAYDLAVENTELQNKLFDAEKTVKKQLFKEFKQVTEQLNKQLEQSKKFEKQQFDLLEQQQAKINKLEQKVQSFEDVLNSDEELKERFEETAEMLSETQRHKKTYKI